MSVPSLSIERRFTSASQTPVSAADPRLSNFGRLSTAYNNVLLHRVDSIIPSKSNPFKMHGFIAPVAWSQLAVDIIASKYARKAGVPVAADDMPYHLADNDTNVTWKADVNGMAVLADSGEFVTGAERSVIQIIDRLVYAWAMEGIEQGHITCEESQTFYDELAYMLVHQMFAPNSPQWFNTGVFRSYGVKGNPCGQFAVVSKGKSAAGNLAQETQSSYERPQASACFIQPVTDTMFGDDGIFPLINNEARIFKGGSGTGTNFSALRAANEPLSNGGKSSGLMSWLDIADRAAGAIKSGGTTRRAAKMVILDADHPDIFDFVTWKSREELKVRAMVEGSNFLTDDEKAYAKRRGLVLDFDFNGEAYRTVGGQNANNTVRVTSGFMDKVFGRDTNPQWDLINRVGGTVNRTVTAIELWDEIVDSAWRSADPGLQFDTTIQEWNTVPNTGRVNASNPCSEFLHLDNTACNLASLNVCKFYDPMTRAFDHRAYAHAAHLVTIVLDITVDMSAYPSKAIAENSNQLRPLGIGYANVGALLMSMGIAYDSDEGRAVAATLAAALSGVAYQTSAMIAMRLGSFAHWAANAEPFARVMYNHREAMLSHPEYRNLHVNVPHIQCGALKNANESLTTLYTVARDAWDHVVTAANTTGLRNSQISVIAPTGTIGLLMDCDTTGIEPDFALVKFKKLVGGGYFKIVNNSIPNALRTLGYDKDVIDNVIRYIVGTTDLSSALTGYTPLATLLERVGYNPDQIALMQQAVASTDSIFSLDPALRKRLEQHGLTEEQLSVYDVYHTGSGTIEYAPKIQPKHYAVFACATSCGKYGTQYISADGHVMMMGAVQPFISGAISKTVNLPHSATRGDIEHAYQLAYTCGVKAIAVYRDGCKLSQPLSSSLGSGDIVRSTAALRELATLRAAPIAVSVPVTYNGPVRRKLSPTHTSVTHKFVIGDFSGHLTVGLYDNGQPGEIFITISKEGSSLGGFVALVARQISFMLQCGISLEDVTDMLIGHRFEPHGWTENPDIRNVSSIPDYIGRWLQARFLRGEVSEPATPAVAEPAPAPEPPAMAHVVPRERAKRAARFDVTNPPCTRCGGITTRSGTCHKCHNCGHENGCTG